MNVRWSTPVTGLAMLLSVVTTTALSQPTLTSNDLPQGGQSYLRANALPPILADIEAEGPGLTWDFSTLIPTGSQETEYFPMSAASFTTQFIFSSADHFTAFELPDLGIENPLPFSGATTYHEFGSTAYRIIGLGITTDFVDLPVIYEDDEELLPLPLTYGATLDGTSAFEVDLPELLFYGTTQETSIAVDAWGTLILPGGTYECLRVRRTISAQDSVNLPAAELGFSLPREGTTYEWYAAGEGMPVLSIQLLAGVPAVCTYKPGEDEVIGVEEWNAAAHTAIPNPARQGEDILLAGVTGAQSSVLVTDVAGRVWFDAILEADAGHIIVPAASWPAGTYLVAVEGGPATRCVIR